MGMTISGELPIAEETKESAHANSNPLGAPIAANLFCGTSICFTGGPELNDK